MASQSMEEEGNALSNALVSRLLTVLPVEIRLHIYEEVFHGSRIYTEALSTYWSSTIIDSALNPPFECGDFSEILRTIPVFARPVIREIRCKGFQESTPGLNFKQFVDRFARVETLVMEPDFVYVSRRFYDESDWSANFVINRAQRQLRRQLGAVFGFDGMSHTRVLQRIQFPVIIRSRGTRIQLAARDSNYPAKVFFVNHFKGLVSEGTIDTPDEVGFQQVL